MRRTLQCEDADTQIDLRKRLGAGTRTWTRAVTMQWKFQAVVRPFRALVTRSRTRSGRSPNTEKLEQLRIKSVTSAEALQRFGKESDRDFTAMAAGISKLNEQLSSLREKATQLDLMLADQDDQHALSAASTVFANAVELVKSSVTIARAEQDQMDRISKALLEACKAREVFHRNHLMLRILTMNMRMEAVRLEPENQATFVNIAAAVAEIDNKIVASTGAAFDKIEAVIAEAHGSRATSETIERKLHESSQLSVAHIERELGSLKSSLLPCSEQSRGIVSMIAQTEPLILGAISSLQHQDIVRQQLEHVSHGFDDLERHLEGAGSGDPVDLVYVRQAAQLQQAHLGGARQEIDAAAREVEAGIQGLLDAGEPLLQAFAALEGQAEASFRHCELASVFSREIHILIGITKESEAANSHSASLVTRIEHVVRLFSDEIASHELDVKIVALNAQIASARIASADSLSRIAEEISVVADQNALITRDLTRDFRGSLETVHTIKAGAAQFLQNARERKEELESSISAVSSKLERLGSRIRDASAEAHRDYRAAHEHNLALLQSLNFTRLIDECYGPAEQLCADMLEVTAADAASGAQLTEQAARQLETHRSRYTMHKENATHAAALGRTAAAADASASPEPDKPQPRPPAMEAPRQPGFEVAAGSKGTSDNFGDGIELF